MSQQINLYSPLFRKQKKLFTARAMVQGMALVLSILILFYGYAHFHVKVLGEQAAEVDRRLQAAMQQLKGLASGSVDVGDEKTLDAHIAQLEAKLGVTASLVAQTAPPERSNYLDPLRALARQRMEGVWLTTITLEGEGGDLSLIGRALNAKLVPLYIERLGQDAAMQGRNFSTLSIEGDKAKPAPTGSPVQDGGVDFRLLASGAAGG